MNKSEEIVRRQFSDNYQSWFSKKYASWANNDNDWSKMKKFNCRRFKKKYDREVSKDIQNKLLEMDL
jgi:hypothetical protein